MTFPDAATTVLKAAGEPLHYREVTARALVQKLLESDGNTPEASMARTFSTIAKDPAGLFVRVAPGVYGLREWVETGQLVLAAGAGAGRSMTPHYPSYEEIRSLLRIWDGLEAGAIPRMLSSIWDLTGTPQASEEWSHPDDWIPERLAGESRALALKTWEGSGRVVNPRYCRGHWYFCRTHKLLADEGGKLTLTDSGRGFLAKAAGPTVQQIDGWEGLLFLLRHLGDEGATAPADLLAPWMAYLAQETRIASETTARSYLSDRLRNLAERGLVRKLGRAYELTEEGLQYIEAAPADRRGSEQSDAAQKIRRLIKDERDRVRHELLELLHDLHPYAFEHLVKQLLEAMGYTEVEVTKASNDKGVDVKAKIELGITSVNEVVQAKKIRGNVGRPVLDQLRGSLHRFNAVRGTVITTGGFSKGTSAAAFERGAAPITLIDGAKLVDLLIEYKIGVRKQEFELLTLHPDDLEPDEVSEA